jgi:hypothetical protein
MAVGSWAWVAQDSQISLYIGLLWLCLGPFMVDSVQFGWNDNKFISRQQDTKDLNYDNNFRLTNNKHGSCSVMTRLAYINHLNI